MRRSLVSGFHPEKLTAAAVKEMIPGLTDYLIRQSCCLMSVMIYIQDVFVLRAGHSC